MRHLAFLLSLPLAACSALPAPSTSPEPSSTPSLPDPAHTSRNSLDWAGTYTGVLPCADCPGIESRLTLGQDGSYRLSTRYLEREVAPRVVNGRFQWTADGNHIQLDAAGDGIVYKVGEGQLLRRYVDGTWPEGDHAGTMTLRREP